MAETADGRDLNDELATEGTPTWGQVEEMRRRRRGSHVEVVRGLLGHAAGGVGSRGAGVGLLLPEEGLDVAAPHGSDLSRSEF